MLRSLCSNVESVRATQKCVQRSSAWAIQQTCHRQISRRFQVGCDADRDLDANCVPIRSTRRDNWRQPRSFLIASAWFAKVPRLVWHHPDPEYRPHVHELPKSDQAYRPKCAVFCRLFSFRHRNPAAPFFRSLGALAIQDTGTGFRVSSYGTT